MAVQRRQIQEADLGAVAELLARGFRLRPKTYWLHGLGEWARGRFRPAIPVTA